MPEGIMIALIGLGGSGLGSLIGVIVSSKITTYRLEQLEKKVDKHNSIIERTFVLEGDMKLVKQEINDLKG